MAKTDEAPVFRWVQNCTKPSVDLSDSLPYPILDRVLGIVSFWNSQRVLSSPCIFKLFKKRPKRMGDSQKGENCSGSSSKSTKWRRTRGSL